MVKRDTEKQRHYFAKKKKKEVKLTQRGRQTILIFVLVELELAKAF